MPGRFAAAAAAAVVPVQKPQELPPPAPAPVPAPPAGQDMSRALPSPRARGPDAAQKRRWVEVLAKAKPAMHSAYRKDIESLIEYLLK